MAAIHRISGKYESLHMSTGMMATDRDICVDWASFMRLPTTERCEVIFGRKRKLTLSVRVRYSNPNRKWAEEKVNEEDEDEEFNHCLAQVTQKN